MRVPSPIIRAFCLVSLAGFMATPATAGTTVIDIPGAYSTSASDINRRGDIVGSYYGQDLRAHGFLLTEDGLTTIDVDSGFDTHTSLIAINNRGDIVGTKRVGFSEATSGFLLRDGVFIPIVVAGAFSVSPVDINDRGDIVGSYMVAPGGIEPPLVPRGFLLDRLGSLHTDILPNQPFSSRFTGVNDLGHVVGDFRLESESDPSVSFLFHRRGTLTPLDPAGAPQLVPTGINLRGDIVGYYPYPSTDSVIRDRHGSVVPFAVPGAQSTLILGISDRGDIVGLFTSWDNVTHGFVHSE
jgi:hypothetical protein